MVFTDEDDCADIDDVDESDTVDGVVTVCCNKGFEYCCSGLLL